MFNDICAQNYAKKLIAQRNVVIKMSFSGAELAKGRMSVPCQLLNSNKFGRLRKKVYLCSG